MPSFLRCVHRLEQQSWPSTAPRSAATVCSVNRGHEATWCIVWARFFVYVIYIYIFMFLMYIYIYIYISFILNLNRVSGPHFVFFVISTCGLGEPKWFWCAGGCFSTDMSLYIYNPPPCALLLQVVGVGRFERGRVCPAISWFISVAWQHMLIPGAAAPFRKKWGLATFQAGLTSSLYIYIFLYICLFIHLFWIIHLLLHSIVW